MSSLFFFTLEAERSPFMTREQTNSVVRPLLPGHGRRWVLCVRRSEGRAWHSSATHERRSERARLPLYVPEVDQEFEELTEPVVATTLQRKANGNGWHSDMSWYKVEGIYDKDGHACIGPAYARRVRQIGGTEDGREGILITGGPFGLLYGGTRGQALPYLWVTPAELRSGTLRALEAHSLITPANGRDEPAARLTLRLTDSEKERIVARAKQSGLSINQYIVNTLLSEHVTGDLGILGHETRT